MKGIRNLGLLVLTVALPAACTTTTMSPSPAAPVAAQLSVERFLQAANERDLHAMGNLFGTREGPSMDTGSTFGCAFKKIGSWFGGTACVKRQEVEIRMDAIASILRHQDYRIVREERVAGRQAPTTRIMVDMTIGGQPVPGVPFVVVQTGQGRWLVQEIGLEQAMARGR
jgi:hypothetical protein